MPTPFTSAIVRCRHPKVCTAEQLVAGGPADLVSRLARIGWSQHREHGWLCPQHTSRPEVGERLSSKIVLTVRTRALIQAIHDGHDFGLAIMRETGMSESTVYATLRRLLAAGWTVCHLEPIEDAALRQRPRRKIYRLTEGLLDELGWPQPPRGGAPATHEVT